MTKMRMILAGLCLFTGLVFAGTNKTLWKAYESGNYTQVISTVNKSTLKTAEEYYLLGCAKLKQGDKISAVKAWNEAIQISKNLGKDKWNFLFSPNKKLTATQKQKIYNDFQTQFKALGSALSRLKTNEAKTAADKAVRTNIEANRLDKRADAVSEAIKDKQRVADRKAKKMPRKVAPKRGKIPTKFVIIFLLIIIAVIIFAATRKKSSEDEEDEFEGASFGTTRYNVMRNDDHFISGPFWYEGIYYHSSLDFYRRNNYYYTNSMYMDNYDRYGMGQGRDVAMDEEILRDIDTRQELREESADLEAEAANLEQDAAMATDEAEELADSIEAFDEEPDFGDDEEAEEPEFEDDAEEEPEFEDDVEEEPEFEDDEPEFEDDEE